MPTLHTKTAERALNVAMCTTPTGPPRTPSGHSTPYAEDTTTDHSLKGEWKVSKKKKKEDRQEVSTMSKDSATAIADSISAKEEGPAYPVPSGPQQGGEKRSRSYQGVSTSREI